MPPRAFALAIGIQDEELKFEYSNVVNEKQSMEIGQ
jgi:hypothetical protein